MPNESDYYSLKSTKSLKKVDNIEKGFLISNFTSGDIYHLKDPTIQRNVFPDFIPFLKKIETETEKKDYLKKVNSVISDINKGYFEKVVISKIKRIEKKENFTLKNVFKKLCDLYSNAFVYCISSEDTGTWIGASPELLLRKRKNLISTVSLAGTRIEDVDWTEKERKEQQVVTDYIRNKISPFASSIEISEPYDLDTGSVIHLKSDIKAELKSENSLVNLIKKIHPTPAICGIPTKESKVRIEELESHKRNLYTGFIGPIELNTHSSLFVNLRCMQIHRKTLSLYLGGGIMRNSDPESEWIETENKAKTLLEALY